MDRERRERQKSIRAARAWLTGAEDALAQIKENAYAAQHKTDGKKIVLIGAGFDESARTIKEWKAERL